MAPDFLRWLAGPDGWIGGLDLLLVAPGTGQAGGSADPDGDHGGTEADAVVPRRTDLEEHARVRRARSLLADTLGLVPAGEPVFAAVTPGNARSLRAFLACGFVPIGSEVLMRPARAVAPGGGLF